MSDHNNKTEEESLLSEIESYIEILRKEPFQIAKNKATALEAIVKACRDRGMGQSQILTFLSIAKIAGIKRIIRDEREIIRQYRGGSVLNCFFNLIGVDRVKSNRLVTKLDDYLNTESFKLS